jgi:DUF2075 family protein
MPLALSRTGVVFKKCSINNAGDFNRLARNVCKVLLTRGLRGCVIYSVDPETQQTLAGPGLPMLSAPSGA